MTGGLEIMKPYEISVESISRTFLVQILFYKNFL